MPALTVDRQCGSGLAAIAWRAALVAGLAAALVLAGGVESASTSTAAGASRRRSRRTPLGDPDMGPAADALAERPASRRERQDAYAARSHAPGRRRRATRGGFDAEIVPVGGVVATTGPRTGLTVDRLARLPARVPPAPRAAP